jgi:hypothetical protein
MNRKHIYKRTGMYEQICQAAGVVHRGKNTTKNNTGYFTRDEMMAILIKLTKGHLGAQSCKTSKR